MGKVQVAYVKRILVHWKLNRTHRIGLQLE